MRGLVLALTALTVAAAAHAAPVYLACDVSYAGGDPKHFTVTADEATGKVMHQQGNGVTFNVDGTFTPTELVYRVAERCAITCFAIEYTINRTTMAAHESVEISNRGDANPSTVDSWGQCQIADPPADRKF